MKNENKIFVEELAIFGGAVMLAGSTIGLVLNAFNAPSVVNIIYKGKEVSMTAYSGWDVSFDDYVLCGNCDHVKKFMYIHQSIVNNVLANAKALAFFVHC